MKPTSRIVLPLICLCLSSCVRDEGVDLRSVPNPVAQSDATPTPKPPADPARPKPTSRPSAVAAGSNTRSRVTPMTDEELPKTEAEWRKILSDTEYHVLREKGTEPRYCGLWNNKRPGSYHCAGCGEHLFDSTTKFESGSGWPSFYEPARPAAVKNEADTSLGMVRTEVMCKRCGGHLGHVFDDGPKPTGLRYCINSAALQFKEKE